MCVDYRTLNKFVVRDKFPLPLIEDHLDALRGKEFFSKLDLKNAFYHVKMASDSVKYTSFITPSGQFEFCRMPFGLNSSPATFTRFINTIFRDLIKSRKILIYLDDILIATETINENLIILGQVLEKAKQNLLELRLDKCSFLMNKIDFLGYTVDKDGISPNGENVEAIKNYPVPINTKQVHSFIGLCSYFRRFMKNFSLLAKPLYDLVKKNAKFEFGPEQIKSFEILRSKLMSQPILSIYSPFAETELHCDASALGFGSILLQKQSDGIFHPVFYFSQRTTQCESKYHSFELETLSAVKALRRFHVYLQGIPFKIVTDCDSFRLTLAKKDIVPRIMRWSLLLQNYDYTIEHRSNTRMRHVDALSRIPNIFVLEGNTFEQTLMLKQNLDLNIVKLRTELENAESSSFELRNGVVYRKTNNTVLFYVPESMEVNVLYKYHDEMGHLGLDKTYELITRTYWFPGLRGKIKSHISNCLRCIEYNPKSGKKEGILHSIPKGNLPFETIHLDHYGPLEVTKSKNKHIFEIIDGFTKFIKFYPCKSTSTDEVIKHLKSYFVSYSCPKRIITDRGSCFTSKVFKDYLEEKGIKHVLIATGAPWANGQIEIVNRTLTPMLSKITIEKNDCWDKVLNDVEFCFNNTINRSTGETPAKLLFGRNQVGTVRDNLREILESLDHTSAELLTESREKALERIQKTQDENKVIYDKKHKYPNSYHVGEYVMVTNTETTVGVSKKLIPKYRGPYIIKTVLPNDRYAVTDIIGFQNTQIPYEGILDASRIKPYNS